MAQFLLQTSRGLPSRMREEDTRETLNGTSEFWFCEGGRWLATFPVQCTKGHHSVMYDGISPRYSWKDVLHESSVWNPVIENGKSSQTCEDISYMIHNNVGYDAAPIIELNDVLDLPEVQDALVKVSTRWFDQMYQLRQEPLPDMAVFLAELHEISGLYGIVRDYLHHLIIAAKCLRNMRKVLKTGYRKEYGPTSQKEIKRAKDDLKWATQKASSDLLAIRFGVLQPIRDLTTIIAAAYQYLDAFKFSRETIHVREQVELVKSRDLRNKIGGGLYGCEVACYDQGQSEYMTNEKMSVEITACTDSRPQLDGSRIEKLLALLLRQVEMVPTPDVLWELTPLSWLIDYFVNSTKVLSQINNAAGSMAGVTPIIFNTSVSLKIHRVTKIEPHCPRWYGHLGGVATLETKHYERLIDKSGPDLMEHVHWLKSNLSSGQTQNTVAFLLQLIT